MEQYGAEGNGDGVICWVYMHVGGDLEWLWEQPSHIAAPVSSGTS